MVVKSSVILGNAKKDVRNDVENSSSVPHHCVSSLHYPSAGTIKKIHKYRLVSCPPVLCCEQVTVHKRKIRKKRPLLF